MAKLAQPAHAVWVDLFQEARMCCGGLVSQHGTAHGAAQLPRAALLLQCRKCLLRRNGRSGDRLHPHGRQAGEHIQQFVWIQYASHLSPQRCPVLNLFGRTAMVPSSGQGRSLHQLLLQAHG